MRCAFNADAAPQNGAKVSRFSSLERRSEGKITGIAAGNFALQHRVWVPESCPKR
jgi:hypothetical protein